MNFTRFAFLALLAMSAPSAYSADVSTQVDFGPHIGGGSVSNGANVRNTSGYSLALERHFAIGTNGLSLGPRFEVANSFLSMRDHDNDTSLVSTYDNRFIAAGFTVAHAVGNDHTFAQGAYLSAVAGRGYSKLTIDESTARTHKQNLFGNIDGNYAAAEIGSWIPLKGNFGVNLAFLASQYRADQSDASGTYDGDEIDADGNYALVEGSYPKGTLDRHLTMRTYAAKVCLALGF